MAGHLALSQLADATVTTPCVITAAAGPLAYHRWSAQEPLTLRSLSSLRARQPKSEASITEGLKGLHAHHVFYIFSLT